MLKLKLQYSGHLMQRADSFEKTLMMGGIGGRRRRETESLFYLRLSPVFYYYVLWDPEFYVPAAQVKPLTR